MRKKLTGVVLVLISGAALFASADYLAAPKPPPISAHYIASEVSKGEERLSSHRNMVSQAELTFAISHNLLPPATKSLLNVPTQLKHGDFIWNDEGVPAGKVTIWVDLRRQMISAFRSGHEIGTAVIVFGAQGMESPEGIFKILRKSADYHSRSYDAPMPYSLFITNDGVALHGSPISKRRASHGCIGLPVEFAEKLFEVADIGDRVEITKSEPSSSG